MGLRNSRTGILDFNSRRGCVNDRANQDHPPRAVVADGIVDQVSKQFANQDAIAGDDRGTVKSIELDVDIARESLGRTLRQDIEGDLVQVDIFGGRLRNAGQVEAFTANLIAINRRYKARSSIRITGI